MNDQPDLPVPIGLRLLIGAHVVTSAVSIKAFFNWGDPEFTAAYSQPEVLAVRLSFAVTALATLVMGYGLDRRKFLLGYVLANLLMVFFIGRLVVTPLAEDFTATQRLGKFLLPTITLFLLNTRYRRLFLPAAAPPSPSTSADSSTPADAA